MSFPSSGATQTATIGGIPEANPDVPISAVFLAIYVSFAAVNLTTFIRNRRRKHKFLFSWVLFVFSMIRIATTVLRIVWTYNLTNKNVALVAQIFNNAGILIIYVINFFLAWRILCAKQPKIGWSGFVAILLRGFVALIFAALIMVITAVVLVFTSTSISTLQACQDVLKAGLTYIFVMTVIPVFTMSIALLLPRSPEEENFGKLGSMNSKSAIVMVSVCLSIIISGFKVGTTYSPARLASDPAWYDSKAAFYCFSWMLEVIILAMFAITRVDQRFWIPNGSKGPGDFSKAEDERTSPEELKENS